jgi:ribose transport system permease protein
MTAGLLKRHRALDVRAMLESGVVVWAVVIVIAAYAAATSDDFRSVANLSNLSRQFTVLALACLAQFLVVVTGGVDLSIATNIRLSAIAAAIVMDGEDGSLLPGVAAAIGVGLLIGCFNAVAVTRLRIEPFIATLGTGAILGGTALYVASTPRGRSAPALNSFYDAGVGPVYAVVVLVTVVWLVAAFALRNVWGKHLYAVGGDDAVARLSGVPVDRVRASAYVLAGAIGGLAGLLTLASAGVGDPASATGLEFDSLAAVVIGGASIMGGRGRLVGVLGGVVLFSILGNVFNLLQVDIWYQQVTRGGIILIAASLVVARMTTPRSAPRAA